MQTIMTKTSNTTIATKMKDTSRRVLSTCMAALMAVMLAGGLFVAAPKEAHALTASQLASYINNDFDPGATTNTLNARLSTDDTGTVRVRGTVTGATNTLSLNIDAGVTVRWEARYTGSGANTLIQLSGAGAFEVPTGGLISGSGSTVISLAASSTVSVTISGGIVRNTDKIVNGSNVISGSSIGSTNNVTVSGGEVSSASGYAITVSGNVSVSGGTVSTESNSCSAIDVYNASNTVTISGGTVSATTGRAISCNYTSSTVSIYGNSFVFAWGTNISGNENDVIRGTTNISDNAIICAWNQEAETTTYLEGTSTDLTWITYNSGATVKWARSDLQSGISYAKGSNTGFLPISGVTINLPAPTTYSVSVTGGTGSGNYAAGATVSIAANAIPPGMVFDRWTATGVTLSSPTSANTSFTMPAGAVTLTATYKDAPPSAYTVTVTGGTGSGSYTVGTTVTVTATVPTGKVFDTWSATGITLANLTSASASFAMPANDVTLIANYKDAPTYTVTVVSGTANPTSAMQGTSITITASVAPTGKVFDRWTTTSSGVSFVSATSATTTFVMPASAVSVTATYKDAPVTTYLVTVNSGTGGGNFAAGVTVTITASPAPTGKVFDRWTATGITLSNPTNASVSFTMPASAVTLTATYKDLPPSTYAVNVITEGSGTANANLLSATAGETITLSATPTEGYRFIEWQVTGSDVTITNDSFVMPSTSVTITAIFEAIPGWSDPNTPKDNPNLMWLWVVLGILALVAIGSGVAFVFIKKKKTAKPPTQPPLSPPMQFDTPPPQPPITP